MTCCEPFKDDVRDETFQKDSQGSFFSPGLSAPIKFCPFCGKSLEPRYVVRKSTLLSWLVFDHKVNRNVAFFDCQVHAKEYTEKLNEVL